jgi:hypothetical protein
MIRVRVVGEKIGSQSAAKMGNLSLMREAQLPGKSCGTRAAQKNSSGRSAR